jgi:hypothetical protein
VKLVGRELGGPFRPHTEAKSITMFPANTGRWPDGKVVVFVPVWGQKQPSGFSPMPGVDGMVKSLFCSRTGAKMTTRFLPNTWCWRDAKVLFFTSVYGCENDLNRFPANTYLVLANGKVVFFFALVWRRKQPPGFPPTPGVGGIVPAFGGQHMILLLSAAPQRWAASDHLRKVFPL